MFGTGLHLKATALLVFFLWLVKSLKNLSNNIIVNHLEKRGLSSIFQYGLGLPDQLQIFGQLFLIELPGLLASLELLEL